MINRSQFPLLDPDPEKPRELGHQFIKLLRPHKKLIPACLWYLKSKILLTLRLSSARSPKNLKSWPAQRQ